MGISSIILNVLNGGVAQLGERLNGIQEVRGSIPLVSTIVNNRPQIITYDACGLLFCQHPACGQ